MKTVITDEAFEALFAEMLGRRGNLLIAEEARWHDRVPERVRNAGFAALASPAAGSVLPKPRLPLVRGLLIAAAAAVAAGAVTTAAHHTLPALCEYAEHAPFFAAAQPDDARAPEEYVIPAPWEDYTVRDEAASEHMLYKWFGGGRKQVLVEIARTLPEDLSQTGALEAVVVSGTAGAYCEENRSLLLYDDRMCIYIRYWNGSRDDVFDYAAALIEANQ